MDAQPPNPPLVVKLTPEEQAKLDAMHRNRFNNPASTKSAHVENYGPIKTLTLGSDWKDFGNQVVGGRVAWRLYKLLNPVPATLRVYANPKPPSPETVTFLQNRTKTTPGPVPTSNWKRIKIFGTAGNPDLFKIYSIEVQDLAGKHVIVMTGQSTKADSLEKNVYVSPTGDWTKRYEFGVAATKNNFDKAVEKFDEALKTVVWKTE
ncbi:MAG: hypothetical protein SGJ27_14215 [Candidatus Melainabacteria bacterium]|nr:hypothetical protein [Candidatus Melainabacteria bacterium]